jgi:hypothetical protein
MSLSPFVTSSSSIAAMSSNTKPGASSQAPMTPKTPSNSSQKYAKIIEKILSDLEDLGQKIINIHKGIIDNDNTDQDQDYQSSENDEDGAERIIRDDCYELQKFCFKLEFLLQFELKEKKSFLASASATPTNGTPNPSLSSTSDTINLACNKEYWTMVNDVLKSSRSFQDAIKYVKNINEIKTNLGKGRAFIRFCLQYHRLADAIQQLMMENKVVGLVECIAASF